MSTKFFIREWWGKSDPGTEEMGEFYEVEGYDHADAARRFMESRDPLTDWIENGNEIELLVRRADEEKPQRVDVNVDWDPVFSARIVK